MLQAQEQSGAVEAAVRRAEADRLSLAERQHGAGVAQVVDTDSESDGESDDDDEEEDCGGNGGNGGSGGSVGGGGGLGDVVAADEAGDDDPTGVGESGGSGRGGGRKRGGDALATGAGPGEQAALESRVEEIQLEVRVLSRKKQDLEQVRYLVITPGSWRQAYLLWLCLLCSADYGSTYYGSTYYGRCTAACSSSAGSSGRRAARQAW